MTNGKISGYAFAISFGLFAISSNSAQASEAYESDCLRTLEVVSAAILEQPFPDVARVRNYWQGVGVIPGQISDAMTGSSNLLRLADPTELIPTPEQRSKICARSAKYASVFGKTITARNADRRVSWVAFETNPEERSRINGTWAIGDRDLRRSLGSALQTLTITYRFEDGLTSGKAQCDVFFGILPEESDFSLLSQPNSGLGSEVQVYNFIRFAMPILAVDPLSEEQEVIRMYYLSRFGDGHADILSILDRNYSSYKGGLDWESVRRDFDDLSSRSSKVALRSVSDIPTPRENSEIAQNPACLTALKSAREQYARAATD